MLHRKQRAALWAGITLSVIALAFPPWRYSVGYVPCAWGQSLLTPPEGYYDPHIDRERLSVILLIIAIVTGGLIATGRERRGQA